MVECFSNPNVTFLWLAGILNDIYKDGIKWHDIACYHSKPYVCEDSDQLLEFVRATHPEVNVPEPSDSLNLESIL
jgi:hypothetical protein